MRYLAAASTRRAPSFFLIIPPSNLAALSPPPLSSSTTLPHHPRPRRPRCRLARSPPTHRGGRGIGRGRRLIMSPASRSNPRLELTVYLSPPPPLRPATPPDERGRGRRLGRRGWRWRPRHICRRQNEPRLAGRHHQPPPPALSALRARARDPVANPPCSPRGRSSEKTIRATG